jgi:hypothetical protein
MRQGMGCRKGDEAGTAAKLQRPPTTWLLRQGEALT